MTSFRYAGRFGEGAELSGQQIIASVERAETAYIDDPLSFPWELLDGEARSCPLVIDISTCTPDALIALRPAMSALTEHDLITRRDDPHDPAVERFARHVGASYSTDQQLDESTFAAKTMRRAEDRVLQRTHRDYQTLVVDLADLPSIDWSSTTWENNEDQRPLALAVRVPGGSLRSASGGFGPFALSLMSTTICSQLIGVWGVRPTPGAAVDRAVLVLSRDTP